MPRTLFRTDSSGFASISGTCLYAAAWKTTDGRWRSKSCRILAGSLTSARAAPSAMKRRSCWSSRSISTSAFSEWSTSTIRSAPSGGDLAAELRADRAAGAGDEHGRAGDVGGDRGDVELDGLASEHVLDLHLAQLAGEVEVAGDQLVDARQGLHRDAGVAAGVDDAAGAPRPAPEGMAMITSSGRLSARSRGSSVGRAEHPDAVQAHVLLARVVVDEADRRVAEPRGLQHLPDDRAGPRRRRRRSAPPCRARRADRGPGRSMIVRASRRAPVTSARTKSQSIAMIPRGTRQPATGRQR